MSVIKLTEYERLRKEVHIWAVDLDLWPMRCDVAARALPESERTRSRRLRFDTIRMRYIKCHFLLRVLLGQYLGVDFYDQEFCRNQHGKPSLKNTRDSDPFFFNLSKSGNIGVYVFTSIGEAGVDVEKIHDLQGMDRIVKRFFSPLEIKTFRSLPDHNRKSAFFKYWTRKEALLKAMGTGLISPLDEVDVITGKDEEKAGIFIKTFGFNKGTEWTLRDINLYEGYASALALEGKHPECSLHLRYLQMTTDNISDNATCEIRRGV